MPDVSESPPLVFLMFLRERNSTMAPSTLAGLGKNGESC
jgi:hypothetical protein